MTSWTPVTVSGYFQIARTRFSIIERWRFQSAAGTPLSPVLLPPPAAYPGATAGDPSSTLRATGHAVGSRAASCTLQRAGNLRAFFQCFDTWPVAGTFERGETLLIEC